MAVPASNGQGRKAYLDRGGAAIVDAWSRRLGGGDWEPDVNDVLKFFDARLREIDAQRRADVRLKRVTTDR